MTIGGSPQNQPISGLGILVTGEKGDTVTIRTDDAGIATVWLPVGTYRFTSIEPVAWEGSTYSWETAVRIEPGTGVIRFSQQTAIAVAAAPAAPSAAPQPAAARAATAPATSTRLRVFADCQTAVECDLDYIKTRIPVVDYVRDRTDATVHVLITSQYNGGGGITYTLTFLGLREYAGKADTLTAAAAQSSTADEKRNAIARTFLLGLVPYLSHTPIASQLLVNFRPQAITPEAAAPLLTPDRWNLWVFSINLGGSVNGEKSQRFVSLRGSVQANRISEDWKIRFGVYENYDEARYTLSGGNDFRSYRRTIGAAHLLARSIGAHWSVGEILAGGSSTFYNQRFYARAKPMIEYDVFPYSEATRRQIAIRYAVGMNSFRYEDTTIFGKLEETRPHNSLTAAMAFKQPWGSISAALEANAYLDEFQRNSARMESVFDFRVFKGFSVDLYGGFSRIRDQLYLPKGELSDEDILVRRRQLASNYSFYGGLSFSYTFGAILNNIVNPRFESPSPF
jgi:hypothetical protein